MGTSKAQRQRAVVICACGCGEQFSAFPVYQTKSEGGGLRIPEFKRGHHPNCRKTQTGQSPPWNKGLKKGDHESIDRMGFQKGHPAYADWSHVNERLANDPGFKARWLESKNGQIPWNKGKSRDDYPNGIKSGPEHGNWLGVGKPRDTAEYRRFRLEMFRRDGWTCQECGTKGGGVLLHMDHIEPVCVAPERILDPTNVRTLCQCCHIQTDTYGTKVLRIVREKAK